jgi:hypothetical protein
MFNTTQYVPFYKLENGDVFKPVVFIFLQFFQIVPGIGTTAQGYYI